VLGDSFTVGYEVSQEQTFAAVLEDRLRTQGLPVEVLNAGVSGFGNAEAAVYLERELLRYEPDVVILAFFGNDLFDNVRSGLFRLEHDGLAEAATSYVPGGRLANFLNTNPLFNFLSERSDAFSLVKERATVVTKRQMVKANLEDLARADQGMSQEGGTLGYRERLTGAILDRTHGITSARGIYLIIMSIPRRQHDPLRLTEQFPFEAFDLKRPALSFLATKALLDPWLGKELLYWDRSDDHWTPFSHRVAGEALAELVLGRALEPRLTRH
jgi:lysophospholipase L1-like esterase